jgi:hypothetical protein
VDPDAPDLPRLKRYFTESEQLTADARKNALVAIDYYDSDQFTREELAALDLRGQPAIVINRIKPAINGIIGVTEKGRSDPRAWPRNPGDDDAADAATDVLIQTIETDLKAAWGDIEGAIEKDAVALWADFTKTLVALLPAQYATLKALIIEVLTDVATGDIADIETAVLNKAEAAALGFVRALGSSVLQAVIGIVKAA